MACATLKRSLELDPLAVRPSKRRRFSPISPPGIPPKEEERSPFAEVPRLSLDQISVGIKDEMKRINRRKKLYCPVREGSKSPTSAVIPDSPPNEVSPAQLLQNQQAPQGKEKHLFTFRQVGLICERLLREREDSLREVYDQVLNNKLAEQVSSYYIWIN